METERTEEEKPASKGLMVYEAEALAQYSVQNVKYEITMIEEVMARMNPNMSAIAEWRKKDLEFKERQSELDVVTEQRSPQPPVPS